MIIGLLNQKGGVGKTTLSVSIAHELLRRQPQSRVLVADADPQQSSLTWSEARNKAPPFHVIGLAKKSIHRDLPPIAVGYDFTNIDGPAKSSELARSCIMAADVVIVPCTPSPYDVWASKDTVDLIEEANIYKDKLQGVFVINRKIANTAIGRDVVEALELLKLPVLKSHVSQRVIFAEAAGSGMTVFDIEPGGKAAQEIIN
tara:strand:+ start:292 stop:897 length:606 start_codon:yes stop_codon:yes gene_type:complete